MKTYVTKGYRWCVVRPLSLVYILAAVMIALSFQGVAYIIGCIVVLTGAAILAALSMVRRELSNETRLLEAIGHEFQPNGGGESLRAALDRVEKNLKRVESRTEAAARLAVNSAGETRYVLEQHIQHVEQYHDGGKERRHYPSDPALGLADPRSQRPG